MRVWTGSIVTGELVAMKTVDKAKLTNENLKKTVEHEIRILKRLHHKHIVKLYEVIDTPRSIHLMLEFVDGGTVQQLVKKHKKVCKGAATRDPMHDHPARRLCTSYSPRYLPFTCHAPACHIPSPPLTRHTSPDRPISLPTPFP